MNALIARKAPTLPSLTTAVLPAIEQLAQTLGIRRKALASEEEIEYAWRDIPRNNHFDSICDYKHQSA